MRSIARTPLWRAALRALPGLALLAALALYAGFTLTGGGFAVVNGNSMEPLLHTGDLVLIVEKRPEEIDVGDIVIYLKGDSYIIHRVILKYKHGESYCFIVKGDNNPLPDYGNPSKCPPPPGASYGGSGIPGDMVRGVVVEVSGSPLKIPYVGGLTLILRG